VRNHLTARYPPVQQPESRSQEKHERNTQNYDRESDASDDGQFQRPRHRSHHPPDERTTQARRLRGTYDSTRPRRSSRIVAQQDAL
jgi:hypothetical protein